jgi:hypothetical protein
MGMDVNATPRPLYPGTETLYPFYRKLGGPKGLFGGVLETFSPPGFYHRPLSPAHYITNKKNIKVI